MITSFVEIDVGKGREERGESRKGERYISVSEIVRRQKLTKVE